MAIPARTAQELDTVAHIDHELAIGVQFPPENLSVSFAIHWRQWLLDRRLAAAAREQP